MEKVIIASLNPAKISAVKEAFLDVFPSQTFEFVGISVPSGVPDQPISDHETKQGALNRVANARQLAPDASYYVGLEAGNEGEFTFAWMVIESAHEGLRGESRSASLMLPPIVLEKLKQGRELGHVMDEVFSTDNIKQKGGAIGLLTQHRLTRSSVYHQALILALIPFMNQAHFSVSP